MKRNKGFTLIELLVVVAIIGSLAAVGVVAYNGYTAAAKKNSSKSIHANAVKYIASELAKCNLSKEEELFGQDTVDCNSTAAAVVALLVGTSSPMQDKNPYDASKAAISEATVDDTADPPTSECEEGYTCLGVNDDGDITIITNYKDGDAQLSNKVVIE
tara:strand:+ start:914 stop:1390 length:477 start_codon:yes stop_codon:yes gene_type:complete